MAGTLYLIPTPLGPTPLDSVLPAETLRVTTRLNHFIVENAKTARAFLKQVGTALPLQQLDIVELNEHTPAAALEALLAPLLAGHDVGLLSEAGCPAIADPGAPLVRLAHQHSIPVKPLVGPSSILLALMSSGLIGQRFAFHGYLPAKPEARIAAIKDLEQRAARDDAAQVFIETPYRNQAMLGSLLAAGQADTWLCVASNLTLADETITTQALADWRRKPLVVPRDPSVFVVWRPRGSTPARRR